MSTFICRKHFVNYEQIEKEKKTDDAFCFCFLILYLLFVWWGRGGRVGGCKILVCICYYGVHAASSGW